jgi:hypothetical protein
VKEFVAEQEGVRVTVRVPVALTEGETDCISESTTGVQRSHAGEE